jgi:hypothetical protein
MIFIRNVIYTIDLGMPIKIFKKSYNLQISPPSAACPSSITGYYGGRATKDGLMIRDSCKTQLDLQ